MKFLKNIALKPAVILACIVLVWLCSNFRLFRPAEFVAYDIRFNLKAHHKPLSDILIIEISDDTLKNLDTWPLPRDFHASLLDILHEHGARMVAFDVLFSESSPYDKIFAEAIKKSDNVYLPLVFDISEKASPQYLYSDSPLLAGLESSLKSVARGIGHINVFVDSDGKIRRAPLLIRDLNKNYVALLGFRLACDFMGLDYRKAELKNDKIIIDKKLSVPLAHDGSFIINYSGSWNSSFQRASYFDIIESYAASLEGKPSRLNLDSLIKNKICFIGLTAAGTTDLRPMPLDSVYPMIGLHASVFDSTINKRFITQAPLRVNNIINILVFVLSLIICLRFAPLRSLFRNIILGVAYFILSVGLFIVFRYVIDLFFPIFIVILTYIGTTAYRLFSEMKKRQLLEKELDIARTIQKSFLPADIEEHEGVAVSSFMQPAKFVAGDLYDIVIIDKDRIGVFIGDVSGKGVPASLIMAQTISLFRIFSRHNADSSKVLSALNNELYGKFEGRFVTCLYMIIDAKEKKASVASAGHSPVLLYHKKDNAIKEVELSAEMPLGIMEGSDYPAVEFAIEHGDRIIVFTDGLSEARNTKGEEFGIDKIKKVFIDNAHSSPERITRILKEAVFDFSHRAPQHDDVTIICTGLK